MKQRFKGVSPVYVTSVSATPLYAIRTGSTGGRRITSAQPISSARMVQQEEDHVSHSAGAARAGVSPRRPPPPRRKPKSPGQDSSELSPIRATPSPPRKAEEHLEHLLDEASSDIDEASVDIDDEYAYVSTQSMIAPEFDAPLPPGGKEIFQPMEDPFGSSTSSEEEFIKSFVGRSTIEVGPLDETAQMHEGANDAQTVQSLAVFDDEENETEVPNSFFIYTSTSHPTKLPPLPDFPPPKTEKEAYKEYMILRYEYQRRGLLKKAVRRMTEPNSPGREMPVISIPINGPRDKIAREILTTEQTYVHHLGVLGRIYLRPLLAWAEEKKQHAIHELFLDLARCIDVLYPVHRELLDAIQVRMKNWSAEQTIGEVFGLLAAHLDTIAAYVRAYEEMVGSLDDCDKNAAFAAVIQSFKQDPACKSLDLRSHLILPVQRIPRYELLLRDFMKHTDESHLDYPRLKIALAQVESVALGVNEAVRAAVNARKIKEISSMFVTDPGLDDGVARALVKEGELFRKGRRPGPRKMFLFSDMLVYARFVTQTKYLLSQKIMLSNLSVDDVPDDPYSDPPLINAILFKSSSKTFLACSTTVGQKQEWLEALAEAMKVVTRRRNSSFVAPIWQPNNSSPCCPICFAKWSLIRQRHHCRICGSLACDSCSSHRLKVNSLGAAPIRACKKCFIAKQSEILLCESGDFDLIPNVNM